MPQNTTVPPALKVVALLSGGKDSLFSLLHLIHNGHTITCLANLHPPESHSSDDLDSFMYQTVGHSALPSIASALQLPLFHAPITGHAADGSLNYESDGAHLDEAEDLRSLLETVLKKHPEVNAVSTGAILSTYQRSRVESVALRLGLTPLSYLWQYPYLPPYSDASLLEDMNEMGQKALIIKVASGGLDSSFLGLDVSDPKTRAKLQKRMKSFEPQVGALLGEGGEYETLAIGGPKVLWNRKVELGSPEVISGEGGSAAIRYGTCEEVDNDNDAMSNLAGLRIPQLLDYEFLRIVRGEDSTGTRPLDIETGKTQHTTCSLVQKLPFLNMRGSGDDAATQMRSIMDSLDTIESPQAIVSTTLILRSMNDFGLINTIYCSKHLKYTLPPARVTIAAGDLLPAGCHVTLSLRFSHDLSQQPFGLHVQSRSYWAPANIGPYSQARIEPLRPRIESASQSALVHFAGQIPLVPARMDLLRESDLEELGFDISDTSKMRMNAALAAQHLWRVGQATDVKAFTGGLAFVSKEQEPEQMWKEALLVWRRIHAISYEDSNSGEDDGECGVEDGYEFKNGRWRQVQAAQKEDTRPALPNWNCLAPVPMFTTSKLRLLHLPLYVVEVAELPKSAMVEWWSIGINSTKYSIKSDQVNGLSQDSMTDDISGTVIHWIGMPAGSDHEAIKNAPIWEELDKNCHTNIYTSTPVPSWLSHRKAQVVPAYTIYGEACGVTGRFDVLVVATVYADGG